MPDRQALCDHAARTYDEETVMSRLLQLFGAPA
jgi:hypothetical protein